MEVLGCQVDYYKRVCVHKPDQIVYQDTKLFPFFACLGAMKEANLLSQVGHDHGNPFKITRRILLLNPRSILLVHMSIFRIYPLSSIEGKFIGDSGKGFSSLPSSP